MNKQILIGFLFLLCFSSIIHAEEIASPDAKLEILEQEVIITQNEIPVVTPETVVSPLSYSFYFEPNYLKQTLSPVLYGSTTIRFINIFNDLGIKAGGESQYTLSETSLIEAKGYLYARYHTYESSWTSEPALAPGTLPAPRSFSESNLIGNLKTLKYANQLNSQWKIEIGRQSYQWGRFDFYSLTNIISPVDYNFANIYSFSYSLEREGIWSFYSDYYLDPTQRLEFVFSPEFELQGSMINYYNSLYKSLTLGTAYDLNKSTSYPKVSEFGLRYTKNFGNSDISFLYYQGIKDSPYQITSNYIQISPGLYVSAPLFELKPYSLVGTEGSLKINDSLLLKGEFVYYLKDYVSTTNQTTSVTTIHETSAFAYMVGLDTQTFFDAKLSLFLTAKKYNLSNSVRSQVNVDEDIKPGLHLFKILNLNDRDLTVGYLMGSVDQYILSRQIYARYVLNDQWYLDGSYTAIDYDRKASPQPNQGLDSDVVALKAHCAF